MSDKDIFDNDKGKNLIPDDSTDDKGKEGDEPTADQLLAKLQNEDGTNKYSSIEEALKGAAHAQELITKLQSEAAEFKDKDTAADKLDELLKAVKESKGSGTGDETDTSAMKPEDVLGIVKDYFDDTKAAETREGNINTVAKAFKDRYGKDASKELYGKAEDLGFGRDEINRMIANNPNAVLKIFDVTPKKDAAIDTTTHQSQIDAANFRQKNDKKPDSIMGFLPSGALEDAWAASKQRTLKRLGLEEK